MVVYNSVPPPKVLLPNGSSSPPARTPPPAVAATTATATLDIDAWTISALQALSVSPVARGTGTPLSIPIDEHNESRKRDVAFAAEGEGGRSSAYPPNRPPSRRDSQRRREALLKGKEGSRQRRRWENDRFVHVPNVQPPEPFDWEVHPTHPIHRVPYQLAQFWDRGVRQRADDKTARLQATRKKQQRVRGSATGLGVGEVPRDLREATKRSPMIRAWVRVLEEPVRQYLLDQQRGGGDLEGQGDAGRSRGREDRGWGGDGDGADSDDEEIVFAGRGSSGRQRRDEPRADWKHARREVSHETVDSGMVLDSFGDDESAAYKRWLTHSIADFYGLESSSVTLANPARRVVYIGFKQSRRRQKVVHLKALPTPLWEIC